MKLNPVKARVATVMAVSLLLANVAKADYNVDFRTFNNIASPPSSTNPVFDFGGALLTGAAGFVGQLYTAIGAGPLVAHPGGSVAFLGGTGSGFINGDTFLFFSNPSVTIDTAGFYNLRVWNTANGSTFEAASGVAGAHVGESGPIAVTFKGYVSGNTPPVGIPAANLHSSFTLSVVPVPEPATLALGAMGMAGLFLRRRKQ